MKNVKSMKFEELEAELANNRCEMRTATIERKRTLINRNHDIMTEMDARWEKWSNK